MKNFRKNEIGITLIALVITVIVLLILAGVTIVALSGDNGILTRAQDAKEKTEQAEKDEKINLARTEDLINEYINGIEVEQVTDENPGILETEGTDTYVINSMEDLIIFVYNGNKGETYEGKIIKLGIDLDLNSEKSYVNAQRTDYGEYGYQNSLKETITETGFITNEMDFLGTFEGNNKIIKNLYINISDEEKQRPIGFININRGVIKNLDLIDVNINVLAKDYAVVGGITAQNYNTVQNCFVSGIISGKHLDIGGAYIGGIVGINNQNSGNITFCSSNVDIESTSIKFEQNGGSEYGGGICGFNHGTIEKCYNLGDINVYSDRAVSTAGGICGRNSSRVLNCYNLGDVNATANISYAGAITGYNETNGIVNNCMYNNNSIEGVALNEENGTIKNVIKDESLNEEKILQLIS